MRSQEMFTDGQLDGQTDAVEFPDRKKSCSGLRPEELIISKRALKKGPQIKIVVIRACLNPQVAWGDGGGALGPSSHRHTKF